MAVSRTGLAVHMKGVTTFNAFMTTITDPIADTATEIVTITWGKTPLAKCPVTIELKDGEFFIATTVAGNTSYTKDLKHAFDWSRVKPGRDLADQRPGAIAILSPNPDLHGDYRRIEIGDRAIRVTQVKS